MEGPQQPKTSLPQLAKNLSVEDGDHKNDPNNFANLQVNGDTFKKGLDMNQISSPQKESKAVP